MLFARTSKAARRLHADFSGGRVVKRYIALVESRDSLPCGKWLEREDRLVRGRGFTRRAGDGDHGVKTARLRYTAIAVQKGVALLVVDLLTGRKHQIRAQLAGMHMPVAGDALYGASRGTADGALFLHAAYLRFPHPTRDEEIELLSRLPQRFHEHVTIESDLEERILTALRDRSSR
jgi:23S rRNA pseudouridine1911/1915/1917 synthase